MKTNGLLIHPTDDVAVALEDIPAGSELRLPDGRTLAALDDIPFGHKMLLVNLSAGVEVRKYGEVIGRLNTPLKAGNWLHAQHFDTGEMP